MMQLSHLDLVLWATALVGHIVLLSILLFRRSAYRFPWFMSLIALNILRTVMLYLVYRHGSARSYFYAYWSLALLDVGVQLCVVVEIALQIFRPLGTWAPDLWRSFTFLLAGCVGLAAGLTWLAAPPTVSIQQRVVLRGSLFSEALMSELFLGMSALSVSMGLPWKTHLARIAQGLGIFSIASILFEGLNNFHGVASGTGAYTTLAHLRILVYQGCLVYWIVMLARSAPQPKPLPERLRRHLSALEARLAYDLQLLRGGKN